LKKRIRLPSGHRASGQDSCEALVDLIEMGLVAREREQGAFLELAERLVNSSNAAEQKRLKKELARTTFGE